MGRSTSLVVVSGLAGAGKSAALNSLEDLGYYCVDNLPPALMSKFADLFEKTGSTVNRAALVVDARTHGFLGKFAQAYRDLEARSGSVELAFFDADDSVLQQRYSETRRPHPLGGDGDILTAIRKERKLLEPIRDLSTRVIDTSNFTPHDLREFLFKLYGSAGDERATIRVVSFAFRSGLPKNADLVFDVRFLPNPNYIPDLKLLSGIDRPVSQYVESRAETIEFLDHVENLLRFVVPRLGAQGRAYMTLAFGCTGGHHRSVVIASRVARDLEAMGYSVTLSHRELMRETEKPATVEEV